MVKKVKIIYICKYKFNVKFLFMKKKCDYEGCY